MALHAGRDRDLTVAAVAGLTEAACGGARLCKLAAMSDQRSLHDLVSDAIERAAEAQEESHQLVDRGQAISAEVARTLEVIRAERRLRTFGNGQRGARRRSGPG